MNEPVFDISIFEKFQPWKGRVRAGYFSNFLGTMTRAHYWAFSPEHMAIFSRNRYQKAAVPRDETIIDLAGVLRAVNDAKEKFTMAAVGCGWGRWLVSGAAAARQRGLPFFLIGVEAEPTHFQWISEHLRDNDIDPSGHVLLEAAAAQNAGQAWFCYGNPAAWYGQAMVSDDSLTPAAEPNGAPTYCGNAVRRVPTVGLAEIARHAPKIDYLHMDIQGAELDFLSGDPDILDRTVKRVLVGAHSAAIEEGLRSLFSGLGWHCEHDLPMNSVIQVAGVTVNVGDGEQGWLNPREIT